MAMDVAKLAEVFEEKRKWERRLIDAELAIARAEKEYAEARIELERAEERYREIFQESGKKREQRKGVEEDGEN